MGVKQDKSTKNNNEGEKKNDGGLNTIIMKLDMHCEGCAKKVRKSIMKLEGVENVKTDCSTNKLVVTGKVDPVMIKERLEEKMKKPVQLVSLQPNKSTKDSGNGSGGEKKSDNKKPEEKNSEGKSDDKKNSEGKSDEKKKTGGNSDDKKNCEGKSNEKKKFEGNSDSKKKSDGKSNDKKTSEATEKVEEKEKPNELPVATVQLTTKVHCEGCSHKIKRIVSKFEGVQDVNVDLKKDMITAKGTMNMKELLPYLNIKLKRAVELAPTKKDGGDKKPKEGGGESEKLKEGDGKSDNQKATGGEKKEGGGGDKKDASGDKKGNGQKKNAGGSHEAGPSMDIGTRIEVSKMEYNPYGYDNGYSYTYDPRQQGEGYGQQVMEYWHAPEYSQPPQMFSDENPNACSIM